MEAEIRRVEYAKRSRRTEDQQLKVYLPVRVEVLAFCRNFGVDFIADLRHDVKCVSVSKNMRAWCLAYHFCIVFCC